MFTGGYDKGFEDAKFYKAFEDVERQIGGKGAKQEGGKVEYGFRCYKKSDLSDMPFAKRLLIEKLGTRIEFGGEEYIIGTKSFEDFKKRLAGVKNIDPNDNIETVFNKLLKARVVKEEAAPSKSPEDAARARIEQLYGREIQWSPFMNARFGVREAYFKLDQTNQQAREQFMKDVNLLGYTIDNNGNISKKPKA